MKLRKVLGTMIIALGLLTWAAIGIVLSTGGKVDLSDTYLRIAEWENHMRGIDQLSGASHDAVLRDAARHGAKIEQLYPFFANHLILIGTLLVALQCFGWAIGWSKHYADLRRRMRERWGKKHKKE